jgi:AraC-like DNA-binding protein
VQDLAQAMNMSQDQLYRKTKALTGLSINQFIRHLRLVEAKRLLATKKHTISEIVFMVGFKNASYFTKSFKKEFGILPTEYSQILSSDKNIK